MAVGAALLMTGCDLLSPTIEQIPGRGENLSIDVVACNVDPATGLATATFELTSKVPYGSILLRGEMSDENGVVVGTGTGALSVVQPGKTYREDIVFSLSGEPQGRVDCDVSVELANP